MKHIAPLFFSVAIAALSMFTACKKDSTDTPAPPVSQMTFNSGGTAYTVPSKDSLSAISALRMVNVGWSMTGTQLLITARVPVGADTNILYMSVKNAPSNVVGSFPLAWTAQEVVTILASAGTNPNAIYSIPCMYGNPKSLATIASIDPTNTFALLPYLTSSGSGTCNITSFDATKNTLSGTFNFTVGLGPLGTSTITDGVLSNIHKLK